MATVMNAERDPADLETLPEYVRENKSRSRDSLEFVSNKPVSATETAPSQASTQHDPEAPHADVLEALWPGVHHQEFISSPVRRSPSFYMTIGFMAGAAVSLAGIWLFSMVPPMVSGWSKPNLNNTAAQTAVKTSAAAPAGQSSDEAVPPAESIYEVQSGDTLAAIALRNYKRVSPRLLDEICAANNMKNANVLSMGQKLNLPVYHPQARTQQTPGANPTSGATTP